MSILKNMDTEVRFRAINNCINGELRKGLRGVAVHNRKRIERTIYFRGDMPDADEYQHVRKRVLMQIAMEVRALKQIENLGFTPR